MKALLILLILEGIYGSNSSAEIERYKVLSAKEGTEISEEVPTTRPTPASFYGEASWYSNDYCKKHNPACITASGEVFDETKLTCACDNRFNLGDRLRVTYKNKSVEIVCNDRGNFKKYGVTLDLAKAAFQSLASTEAGKIKVKIEKIDQK